MTESACVPTTAVVDERTAHLSLTRNTDALSARQRWWITYRIGGDLRFISHHDTMRLFRRALARADLPVRFSEGFNPHPKMTVPLPRPVGVSSDSEVIVIETIGVIDAEQVADRLSRQMPQGIELTDTRALAPGERPQPDTVTYRFQPEEPLHDELPGRINRVLEAATLPVERADNKTKRMRTVDLRPYLIDLRVDDGCISFTVRVTGTGSARPHEIVDLVLDHAGPINHRIHRQSVRWR